MPPMPMGPGGGLPPPMPMPGAPPMGDYYGYQQGFGAPAPISQSQSLGGGGIHSQGSFGGSQSGMSQGSYGGGSYGGASGLQSDRLSFASGMSQVCWHFPPHPYFCSQYFCCSNSLNSNSSVFYQIV